MSGALHNIGWLVASLFFFLSPIPSSCCCYVASSVWWIGGCKKSRSCRVQVQIVADGIFVVVVVGFSMMSVLLVPRGAILRYIGILVRNSLNPDGEAFHF